MNGGTVSCALAAGADAFHHVAQNFVNPVRLTELPAPADTSGLDLRLPCLLQSGYCHRSLYALVGEEAFLRLTRSLQRYFWQRIHHCLVHRLSRQQVVQNVVRDSDVLRRFLNRRVDGRTRNVPCNLRDLADSPWYERRHEITDG